ncbi:tyrosine-type recombinase/integrase [Candidatus Woesearchaeota archaeon]|nr:tyrosine-type recombinase/integrase [Candidatus Woesearchaeota archaeon]
MLLEGIRKEGMRRGLSPRTIKTYFHCVQKFLRINKKELKFITKKDVENYLFGLMEKGRPGNTVNVYLNAIKFFFDKVLKRQLTVNITYSKTPKHLPEFLTKEEVVRLFEVIKNQKHLLMIKLMYATGMRVSELASLKVKDFEFDQNYGWVRKGKGNKDRLFVIAAKLKEELLMWIKEGKLDFEDWLFSGQGRGHISAQTIYVIVKRATKDAGIKKKVHPHTLRHSFATHLIQNGYAVTEVQPLLGHSKMETTMIYLHMASPNLLNVKSPLDSLKETANNSLKIETFK